ncbi:unnamed protein product [Symbiodinium sp. CCMP2592]|nr:unnamed protein product [Symbiodinium sp. CCMP2592]
MDAPKAGTEQEAEKDADDEEGEETKEEQPGKDANFKADVLHCQKISVTGKSGCFYIAPVCKKNIESLNKTVNANFRRLVDKKVDKNGEGGLTAGWSKFESLKDAWTYALHAAEWEGLFVAATRARNAGIPVRLYAGHNESPQIEEGRAAGSRVAVWFMDVHEPCYERFLLKSDTPVHVVLSSYLKAKAGPAQLDGWVNFLHRKLTKKTRKQKGLSSKGVVTYKKCKKTGKTGGPRLKQTQCYPVEFGKAVSSYHIHEMASKIGGILEDVQRFSMVKPKLIKDTPDWARACLRDIEIFLEQEQQEQLQQKQDKMKAPPAEAPEPEHETEAKAKARLPKATPPSSDKSVRDPLACASTDPAPTKPGRAKRSKPEQHDEGDKPKPVDASNEAKAATAKPRTKKLKRKNGFKKGGKGAQAKNLASVRKRKARKLYMRFWRSVKSSSLSLIFSVFCGKHTPNEIKKTFERFKYCKTKMSTLYEDFVSTGGKWKNGIIYKTVTSKRKNSSLGCRKWLTRSQLLQHFDNDKDIVDAVILRKETDPELRQKEIREHPECPSLTQYLVLVDDAEYDESAVEISDLFQAEDYMSETKTRKKKKKTAKKDKKDKKSKKNKKDKKASKKRKSKNKKGEDTEEKQQAKALTMEANKARR